ncbi:MULTISPECIES: sensor domain-containing diguanylate cyclase [Paraburkholderia]|uniref:Diguanylate cyclase with GAF sensor n=1 Tax=Paraburkholderia tropica TaxID=92647 RepID=A0ABX5MUH9_9BURK|nr:sensor domain-containing diguanylate cyclase [Paraburkholderia tropica]MBB6320904.1 diguanylate cyclase (GGDEF)-like protein [Paraburkholderia tropica]MDE1140652.1 sensor domain-containing diguanylate cyclase [Paraburkholderia tropica]OBR52764.1 diguanylate cyclase [Paraburkholderia tropica]PXX19196.1 diguanylate cyclase with GAF sensor [Paraburkholderia tropica]PZW88219.1 diguanylate cyclase with GAF sensor [Paraburkholderia tropica]
MLRPSAPENEAERVEILRSFQLLDTQPEERFDRITRLARRLFNVPIAAVTLVDTRRQWFKSHPGLDVSETPRDVSFCGHAILGDDLFFVSDARTDVRFADNPLVTGAPNIRFYAGCPLSAGHQMRIGTLCLIDDRPREFDDEERIVLRDLADMAQEEIAATQLATTDELTGLSNRRGFKQLAEQSLRMRRSAQQPVSLLYLDLNGFKQINDTYGHAEGDRALVAFATIMLTALGEGDVIGRLGGDEFAVLLGDADEAGTLHAIERIRSQLEVFNRTARKPYELRCSVGNAAGGGDFDGSIDDLLVRADTSMYQQKRATGSERR